jgi:hypothetical protein
VVFTEPEVAWCGLTEAEAKAKGIAVEVAKFPWAASGRALTLDRTDGLTKLIIEPESERILGVGITGHGAGELIAEGVVAVEMGATVKDLAECVHPHPTLSETLMECAEAFYGHATRRASGQNESSCQKLQDWGIHRAFARGTRSVGDKNRQPATLSQHQLLPPAKSDTHLPIP